MPTVLAQQTMVKFLVRLYDIDMEPIQGLNGTAFGSFILEPGQNLHGFWDEKARRLLDAMLFDRRIAPQWFGYGDVTFEVCVPNSNVVASETVLAFSITEVFHRGWGMDRRKTRI